MRHNYEALEPFAVQAGDVIRFEVNSAGSGGPGDAVSWIPTIAYTP